MSVAKAILEVLAVLQELNVIIALGTAAVKLAARCPTINSSTGDNQIDATDDESGKPLDYETDRRHRTARSSMRKCTPNTESDCNNGMCCANFKKLTRVRLQVMLKC